MARPSWLVVAGALLALLTFAACSTGTGVGTWSVTFPPESGEVPLDPMAVTLIDQTGLVTAFAPAPGP